jgi:hypothetical protein
MPFGPAEGQAVAACFTFTSLPECLHLIIAGCLDSKGRLAVSTTAWSMVRLYGVRFERLVLGRLGLDGRALDAVSGFLCRQEQLLELQVDSQSLLPAVAAAIAAGGGRHLKKLLLPHRPDTVVTRESTLTLTQLFIAPHGYVPVLEELLINMDWNDGPSLEVFLAVLAHGAAPRLRKLCLLAKKGEVNASAVVAVLGATLETRAAKGCAALAELDLGVVSWATDGPLDVRRRVWSVLLPTVETIPYDLDGSMALVPFVDALLEQGAPCLRTLYIWNDLRLVLGLAQFSRLEVLQLWYASMGTVEALEGAMDAAGGAEQFLPALQKLQVSFDEEDMEDSRAAFLAWAGRTGAFPRLLTLECVSDWCGGLGAALAAGAFAALEKLKLKWNSGIFGAKALVQGLALAPCARTLRSFKFIGDCCHDSGEWISTFGAAIGACRFPALAELMFEDYTIDNEAVVPFASSLTAAGSQALEELHFQHMRFGNAGLTAIAAALREGRLGARLRELSFHEDEAIGDDQGFLITDASVVALGAALVAGKQFVTQLEYLQMFAYRMTMKGAKALVEAAAFHCLRLKRLEFRGRNLTIEGLRALVKACAPAREIAVGQ